MRILGIDPGYDRCGIAIIEKKPQKNTLIASACITTDPKKPFTARLLHVAERIEEAIITHTPAALAIETLIFNNNQKTALHVAEVRGAIMYLAGKYRIPFFEYSPQQIKAAVSGSGRGSKEDVARMVHLLLVLEKKKRLDDEYDAIATALTHSAIHRTVDSENGSV